MHDEVVVEDGIIRDSQYLPTLLYSVIREVHSTRLQVPRLLFMEYLLYSHISLHTCL